MVMYTGVSRAWEAAADTPCTSAKGLLPQFLAVQLLLYVRCANEYVRETVLLGEAATQPLAQR